VKATFHPFRPHINRQNRELNDLLTWHFASFAAIGFEVKDQQVV